MKQPRQISFDNGRDFKDAADLTDDEVKIIFDHLAAGYFYEPDIAEAVSWEFDYKVADRDWLAEYMTRLPYDIVIG